MGAGSWMVETSPSTALCEEPHVKPPEPLQSSCMCMVLLRTCPLVQGVTPAAALSQQPDTAAPAQGIPCRVLALFISSCTHQTIMFKNQHSYKTPAVCFFQCHSGLLIVWCGSRKELNWPAVLCWFSCSAKELNKWLSRTLEDESKNRQPNRWAQCRWGFIFSRVQV